MNREKIEQNLKQVPTWNFKSTGARKANLRVALLEYGSKHSPSFVLWVKNGIKNMFKNFKLSSFVAGALAAAVVLGGVQFANSSPYLANHNPFATKKAQAQAAVKNAMFKAKLLSPEQRAEIEGKMKADIKASLEEAYAAKDLTISDKSEMQKDGIFTFSIAKPAISSEGEVSAGPKTPEVEKYLKYTDPKGRQVVLGLNAEGVVVFKMAHIQISEGDKQRIEQEVNATGGFGFPAEASFKINSTASSSPVFGEAGVKVQMGNSINLDPAALGEVKDVIFLQSEE